MNVGEGPLHVAPRQAVQDVIVRRDVQRIIEEDERMRPHLRIDEKNESDESGDDAGGLDLALRGRRRS